MTTHKKVVIIGPAYPLRGGLATFNELLANRLQSQGADVQLITFSLQYPKLLFPGKTQYSDASPPEGLTIKVWINSINPFNWLKVGWRLKKLRPDLVIFRYWMPFMAPSLGTIARICASNKHSRVVAIADNIIPHEKQFFDTTFTKYFVKSMHGFVTMSKAVLQDLQKINQDKPALFNPHPMYESFGAAISQQEAIIALKLDPQYHYLLFFGFIRPYKGLDVLLKAIAHPSVKQRNIKLLVAGEFYDKPDSYLQLINELSLQDKVLLHTDFIPDKHVHLYFCASDIVVQPYKTATQSGVTQIAYFYHKPMIVTNVGGLAELVPNDEVGYVVDVNEEALAVAICKYFDEEKEATFVKNISVQREKYTWESMINALWLVSGSVGSERLANRD